MSDARSSSYPSVIALGYLYEEVKRGEGQGYCSEVNALSEDEVNVHESKERQQIEQQGLNSHQAQSLQ